jgi:hypothetical protein
MKSEQVIEELNKVIESICEKISFLPKDIAIIANINGEMVRILYEDLHKYKCKNGELKLKKRYER